MTPDVDSVRQPVEEKYFDDLANRIAERVKGDMGLEGGNSRLSSVSSASLNSHGNDIKSEQSWGTQRCETFTRDVSTFNGTAGLTSHSCTVCKKLMVCMYV